MVESIYFSSLTREDERGIVALIRRNMEAFGESEAVLVATFRRLNDLFGIYTREGCQLFVAKAVISGQLVPIACAGVGPLHGLPLSEGIGEIRDLVVEASYRGQGIGTQLLSRCIAQAKAFGYQRLYLETSQNMVNARKLFLRSGFRPVTESTALGNMEQDLPCYFLLENLS